MLGVRRGVELDQLEQLVAPDHLAGGGGDVFADLELTVVGLADLQLAGAALQIGGEVLHSLDQRLAARFGQGLQRRRVGGQEVGGREGVGQQFGEELGLALHAWIDVLDAGDQAVHPFRCDQIGLAHDVEDRVLAPGRVAKPLVGGRGGGDLFAHGAAGGRGPQVHVAAEQVGLGLKQLFGAGRQTGHDRGHGRGHVEGVGRQCGWAVGLAESGFGDGRLGRHGGLGQVQRQGFQQMALIGAEGEGIGGGLRLRRGLRLWLGLGRRFGRRRFARSVGRRSLFGAGLGRGRTPRFARRRRGGRRGRGSLGRALGHGRTSGTGAASDREPSSGCDDGI
ncbi:hypothetical protein D3C71_1029150 [compost metagenome]